MQVYAQPLRKFFFLKTISWPLFLFQICFMIVSSWDHFFLLFCENNKDCRICQGPLPNYDTELHLYDVLKEPFFILFIYC
ncbi:hypothetical protein GDO86_000084 [Hymenochirus boettgeri]|uniref:Uncharacterized protein n=1 Tax=Hymenochirus boettgeri TaxID=247094 RepID=A0A8T2K7X0_9PIPI|nr:hypothetical protein GDO86_000084 [Hymenochirus boettgeri]